MGKFWGIVSTVLGVVVKAMTPELEKAIEGFLRGLYVKAKATTNDFDDMAIEMIADLMDIDLKK